MDIPHTTPQETQEALTADPKATYLDVRTEAEFEQGHPPRALNVPIMLFDASGGPAKLNERFVDVVRRHIDPAATVFVGCQSGMRSQRAAELLARAGFQSVTNVSGGFGGIKDRAGNVITPGWRDSGLPVETGQPSGQCYRDLASET
jgi:rhodanese-related sulfurtransferase